ncbi:dihydrolipoamide acetyltransferase family protein (plasmid) [Novosphingobium resinovorum]|uniref:dihydrolipoamide acetyltransferase family protein n=1 Tax=Novosphingobium TaxID=165696 RepID=UPI001B3C9391|nr:MULTISPECIES: dihydrolipoamide acetyltransferase family protein [Novosphingobium]MBF7015258.1 2-oxo acid dehydrogenase subunit E2 [Novosphingobium sp. HR1a]WJM29933.1 dihydrolipoamide acetyltransferase family protein [Novosphingobium resinovorum]
MAKLRAFTMPKWGIEMTEGTIADWNVAEGAAFRKGEVIALIETDKITNEYEAEFDAVLARIIVPQGDTVEVGTVLGVFSEGDASANEIDAFLSGKGVTASAAPKAEPASAPAPAPAAKPVEIPADMAISPEARRKAEDAGVDVSAIAGSGRNGRVTLQDVDKAKAGAQTLTEGAAVDIAPTDAALDNVYASPLAKRIAVQNALSLDGVTGTGPRGRICKADVEALIKPAVVEAPAVQAPAPAPASFTVEGSAGDGEREIVKMSSMRKAIARQLAYSKSTIPHFYLRNEARVDALFAMREDAKRATGEAPSVNDYIVRAVALALQKHRDCNVQVHEGEIHRFVDSDIAIAVATDKGLITPIVRAAQTKSVARISAEVKALAAKAREGKLAPEEFKGGSFSISNLGMHGITQFDAIINPPQGAILAVGAARSETFHQDHALVNARRIHMSLSCDHRAIDGAVGASFLAELTRLLENPQELTR